MKRLHSFIGVAIILLFVFSIGCAGEVKKQIKESGIAYDGIMTELKITSEFTVKHWRFGHGLIKGALEGVPQAAYVLSELDKINEEVLKDLDDMTKLTEFDRGYLMGKQVGLTAAVLETILRLFAPELLGASSVLAIIGLL
jgi:hypothetical protein